MKYGVCLELFFNDRPFLERIPAAASAGFRYVEGWFTDMTDWKGVMKSDDAKDPVQLRRTVEKAGVVFTNMLIGSPDGKVGGGLTNPANRRQWLERAEAHLKFCHEAGIGSTIVLTGNHVPGFTAKQMRQSIIDGLKATVKLAENYGIDLLLEPLNDQLDHLNYFLTSSDEGAAICREIGSPRLKMLFDCYHMQITEGDLYGHIRKNLDVIGHIHSAGHPGRHELWLGETNYQFLVKEIEKMGYDRVFGLEYLPTLESSQSLVQTLQYLKR